MRSGSKAKDSRAAIDVPALMKQVARIRVTTNRLVNRGLSGQYHSVFKGHGMEFEEAREYVCGDDTRMLDWNVTARVGRPFVKRFREERELTVIFAIDLSASQAFGSGRRTKAGTAAELACLLALSAIRNQDRIGLLLFSDCVLQYLPPQRARNAVMRFVRDILATGPTDDRTRIDLALHHLNRVQKRRAIVFLISDFLAAGYETALRLTARRHDLICCCISDPRESDLPSAGLLELRDPESGTALLLDSASSATRARVRQRAARRRRTLETLFSGSGIDAVFLSTAQPVAADIRNLFERRRQRRRMPV